MKKIEFTKQEQIMGGISSLECFFALPLAMGEVPLGLSAISITRFYLCWNS